MTTACTFLCAQQGVNTLCLGIAGSSMCAELQSQKAGGTSCPSTFEKGESSVPLQRLDSKDHLVISLCTTNTSL